LAHSSRANIASGASVIIAAGGCVEHVIAVSSGNIAQIVGANIAITAILGGSRLANAV
jgi:hypothetical protein